jgi:hypothetical protein
MEETRRILETMAKEYPKIAEGMGVVSQDEFIAAYKVSKESTSLSPSGRHIGHYKAATQDHTLAELHSSSAIVDEMGLSSSNKNPLMTPFRSGLPTDTIPHVVMSAEDRAPLIAQMQSWPGMINWLQMCTRPDLATIYSLLSSHMHCPSPRHIEAVRYLGKYIHSTSDLGLKFTFKPNATLESYVHFPLSPTTDLSTPTFPIHASLHTFSDANWGP